MDANVLARLSTIQFVQDLIDTQFLLSVCALEVLALATKQKSLPDSFCQHDSSVTRKALDLLSLCQQHFIQPDFLQKMHTLNFHRILGCNILISDGKTVSPTNNFRAALSHPIFFHSLKKCMLKRDTPCPIPKPPAALKRAQSPYCEFLNVIKERYDDSNIYKICKTLTSLYEKAPYSPQIFVAVTTLVRLLKSTALKDTLNEDCRITT